VLRALAFVASFMAFQALWEAARNTWIERLWVHDLTVRSATALINLLTPQARATAEGTRIVAPGGGLNVMFGCEGTDVVFMLSAAFVVFAMPLRARLWGVATGLAWVLLLNQARILALFYVYRSDRAVFELLHSTAAPLLMVVLTGLFFHLWLEMANARLALRDEPPVRTP
jgi:exosortase family protein XrtM